MTPALAPIDRTKLLSLAGIVVLVLCALTAATKQSSAAIPSDELLNSLRPTADVNDYANLLNAGEKQALENRCKQLREKSAAQLAVVILPSLKGGEVQDFTNKLFKRWGVGDKDKKNGLMLLVAIEDHKWWIEVGYGLEPILPDALAGRIGEQQLVPKFKQQQYAAGIQSAVNALCEVVERGEVASPEQRRRGNDMDFRGKLVVTFFLSLFVAVGAGILGLGLGSKVGSLALFGLFFGGIGFFIGAVIAAPLAPIVHLPIAGIMGWLGWRAGRNPSKILTGGRRMPMVGPYWSWGNYSGSSSSGSWSSGGGFSGGSWGGFGGGSSGGGGAGGSW